MSQTHPLVVLSQNFAAENLPIPPPTFPHARDPLARISDNERAEHTCERRVRDDRMEDEARRRREDGEEVQGKRGRLPDGELNRLSAS